MGFFKMLTTTAVAITVSSASFAADMYKTDQGHTEVRFAWNHAGVSIQRGEFTQAEGTLMLDADNVENSSLSATVQSASVSTGFGPLDDHIRNADFLEVETYPTITFESTSVSRTGDKTADITGDLTMHGTTKPVTFAATLTHIGEHPLGSVIDYYKGDWVAFTADTEIDPSDFGVGATIPVGTLSIELTSEMKAPE